MLYFKCPVLTFLDGVFFHLFLAITTLSVVFCRLKSYQQLGIYRVDKSKGTIYHKGSRKVIY